MCVHVRSAIVWTVLCTIPTATTIPMSHRFYLPLTLSTQLDTQRAEDSNLYIHAAETLPFWSIFQCRYHFLGTTFPLLIGLKDAKRSMTKCKSGLLKDGWTQGFMSDITNYVLLRIWIDSFLRIPLLISIPNVLVAIGGVCRWEHM
ncbi:hypothetical protein K443DRAFT_217875 [Laccaria amethystina LaAM-08-1]|uniref:Uncharacterized protein n=1 Tax=Laccaria amethystina LaAM-08-1 TaxID=1095629 RepID=A0A0C9YGJ7_9AGAR|nr:hypothetical protein K443DRAFT_217875 [Laccaria amethystina LaAM-08-1]